MSIQQYFSFLIDNFLSGKYLKVVFLLTVMYHVVLFQNTHPSEVRAFLLP